MTSDGTARLFLRSTDVTVPPPERDGLPARVVDRVWTTRGPRVSVMVDGVAQPVEAKAPRDVDVAPGRPVHLDILRLSLSR